MGFLKNARGIMGNKSLSRATRVLYMILYMILLYELSCLCNIYNTPGLLSQFNVNASQALNLSRRCDVDTDLSSCSASGTPSPKASYLLQGEIKRKTSELGTNSPVMESVVTTVILSLVSTIFF